MNPASKKSVLVLAVLGLPPGGSELRRLLVAYRALYADHR